MVEKQLIGLAGILSRKVISKEEKEVGREGKTPKDQQQQLYTCTEC